MFGEVLNISLHIGVLTQERITGPPTPPIFGPYTILDIRMDPGYPHGPWLSAWILAMRMHYFMYSLMYYNGVTPMESNRVN